MPRALMLVEDDRDVRDSLVEVLSDEGHRALTAASGAEALALLDATPGELLLLLDLRMPGMDGVEFLRRLRLREDAARVSVILMSADRRLSHLDLGNGVVGVLRKPFELSALLALLREQLP